MEDTNLYDLKHCKFQTTDFKMEFLMNKYRLLRL